MLAIVILIIQHRGRYLFGIYPSFVELNKGNCLQTEVDV